MAEPALILLCKPGMPKFPIGAFTPPDVMPKAGDVLVFTAPAFTPAFQYHEGDELCLLYETDDHPWELLCSLGNWVVKCQHQTSVWSNIQIGLATGVLRYK